MSEEEKKAIEKVKRIIERYERKPIGKISVEFDEFDYNLFKTLLNLIEKQQKEIEALKKENLEIRDWKYTIDTIEDLDKLKELDLIKIKGKEYISKDKIKAKIEELEKEQKDNRKSLYNAVNNLNFKEMDKISNRICVNMTVCGILQSLLEEE